MDLRQAAIRLVGVGEAKGVIEEQTVVDELGRDEGEPGQAEAQRVGEASLPEAGVDSQDAGEHRRRRVHQDHGAGQGPGGGGAAPAPGRGRGGGLRSCSARPSW